VVASSPEHLGVMGKRGRERGKAEECGAVLATVTLTTVELRWHLGQTKAAMWLTLGSIEVMGWLRRCRAVWRSEGRDLIWLVGMRWRALTAATRHTAAMQLGASA
jgi:hypothetical protein